MPKPKKKKSSAQKEFDRLIKNRRGNVSELTKNVPESKKETMRKSIKVVKKLKKLKKQQPKKPKASKSRPKARTIPTPKNYQRDKKRRLI